MKKLKSGTIIQIVRHLIQISMFFLAPAIFALGLGGVKTLSTLMNGNSISFWSTPILCLVYLLLTTLIFGRFFCGWICLFGAYMDFIYKLFTPIRKKIIRKKQVTVDRDVHFVLMGLKYVVLYVLIFLVPLKFSDFINSVDVWNIFGKLISLNFNRFLPDMLPGLILFVLISIVSMLIPRFFCRYLCPMGALFSIFDRLHIFRILKKRDICGGCKRCTKECPMGIDLTKKDEINSASCIKCMKCVSDCPRGNSGLKIFRFTVKSALVSTASILVVLAILSLLIFVGIL